MREYNNDAPFNCRVTGEPWYVTVCSFKTLVPAYEFTWCHGQNFEDINNSFYFNP
jgi:hypothetical protein